LAQNLDVLFLVKNTTIHASPRKLPVFFSALAVFGLLAGSGSWDSTAHALSEPLSALGAGPSSLLKSGKLGPATYDQLEVARLAKPKVLWINYDYLIEKGYPVDRMSKAEVEAEILRMFAWVVPSAAASVEITSERRRVDIDYYGGHGMTRSRGSARAFIRGRAQIKGSHRNYLLSDEVVEKTGDAGLHEGIKDAVWGEVLAKSSPNAANRVIGIVDRGDRLNGEPNVLIIRENPLRLGHFVPHADRPIERDRVRAAESVEHISESLVMPPDVPGNAPTAKKVAFGLVHLLERIANQYAFLTANRIYLGAETESNILIDGGSIDFGTATAQERTGKIQFQLQIAGFGDLRSVLAVLVKSPTFEILAAMPVELRSEVIALMKARLGLPAALSDDEFLNIHVEKEFKKNFEKSYSSELISLLGFPKAVFEKIAQSPKALELAEILKTIARAGTEDLITIKTNSLPEKTSQYDLGKILQLLGKAGRAASGATGAHIDELAVHLNDPKLLQTLLNAYQELRVQAQRVAEQDGISARDFNKFVELKSQALNEPMTELFMPNLSGGNKAVAAAYLSSGSSQTVSDRIEKLWSSSQRVFPSDTGYRTTLKLSPAEDGRSITEAAFDARTGRIERRQFTPGKAPLRPGMCQKLFESAH
jgi:hypothetical protein